MADLKQIFNNTKLTENGDIAYTTTGDKLVDILFLTEYYQNHLDKVPKLGISAKEKLFSMFIRDPRFGLGKRDLGRVLMKDSEVNINNIIKVGRYDDLWQMYKNSEEFFKVADLLFDKIVNNDQLAKKWMPRYSSKDKETALKFMRQWKMNKQQYSKFIKANTTEYKMSLHKYEDIDFEKVPSLAMLKYYNAWSRKPETSERFSKYLEDVKSGKKDLKVSTSTVYDIYRNRDKIDPDLFFNKIEKISGNWIPILDTSGSMQDYNDSIGKATSIAHYLAKCSTYMPDYVITFSSRPQLLSLQHDNKREYIDGFGWWEHQNTSLLKSQYAKEIARLYTGDCSNTDLKKVMQLLQNLDKENAPEYLIVLSDMEFDMGSIHSKDETMKIFKENNFNTKIIWWNFNSRNITCPEMDNYGNIFLSGYNPMLLKYLSVNFDAKLFLEELLKEYYNNVSK